MRTLILFVIFSSFFACDEATKGVRYSFTDFELFENPKKLPETFPAAFFYKKAPVLSAGNYGSGGYSYKRQGVVIQSSNDSQKEIIKYYTKKFKTKSWPIIQSMVQKDVSMIMAESSSRRLITVILHGANPVEIKLYYKPISLF